MSKLSNSCTHAQINGHNDYTGLSLFVRLYGTIGPVSLSATHPEPHGLAST